MVRYFFSLHTPRFFTYTVGLLLPLHILPLQPLLDTYGSPRHTLHHGCYHGYLGLPLTLLRIHPDLLFCSYPPDLILVYSSTVTLQFCYHIGQFDSPPPSHSSVYTTPHSFGFLVFDSRSGFITFPRYVVVVV